jgi:hypothetical protein
MKLSIKDLEEIIQTVCNVMRLLANKTMKKYNSSCTNDSSVVVHYATMKPFYINTISDTLAQAIFGSALGKKITYLFMKKKLFYISMYIILFLSVILSSLALVNVIAYKWIFSTFFIIPTIFGVYMVLSKTILFHLFKRFEIVQSFVYNGLAVVAFIIISKPENKVGNAIFFFVYLMISSFYCFLTDATPAKIRVRTSLLGPGTSLLCIDTYSTLIILIMFVCIKGVCLLVAVFFEVMVYFSLIPIDNTKMFHFGHIRITVTAIAANCISNVMLFFIRNIITLLMDRESMVILNSPTTTMQITSGEFKVLKNIDELWRNDASKKNRSNLLENASKYVSQKKSSGKSQIFQRIVNNVTVNKSTKYIYPDLTIAAKSVSISKNTNRVVCQSNEIENIEVVDNIS